MRHAYLLISGTLFALVALAHLVRIVNGWPIAVGEWPVPLWVSWIGTGVPAALSVWAARLLREA